jgi:hypothetical protein
MFRTKGEATLKSFHPLIFLQEFPRLHCDISIMPACDAQSGRALPVNVRFGSKADMCGAIGHVRFTPNSDRKSEFPQKVMSALGQ